MVIENREPVKVFLRIRPEIEGNEDEREKSEVHVDASGASSTSGPEASLKSKECISVLEGGTTVRVNPTTSFNSLGKSRKGREGTLATSTNSMDNRIFTFDKVFSDESTQDEMYKHVSAHVNATVRGYNTTIFAYGSTGSGKTYTMTGNASAPGIIPRAISEIFSIIEATASSEREVFFYVRMSYVELYNNQFRNLLEFASKERAAAIAKEGAAEDSEDKDGPLPAESSGDLASAATVATDFSTHSPSYMHPGLHKKSDKIEVRESRTAGIFLAGPNLRIPVTCAQEAFHLINRGNKVRATAATKCNDFSSRSHAILTIHVESKIVVNSLAHGDTTATPRKEPAEDIDHVTPPSHGAGVEGDKKRKPELRLGKMHLVDLAGSERISLSGAEGGTLLETQSINSSLTAIGDVLAALSRNATIAQKQADSAAAAGTNAVPRGVGKPGIGTDAPALIPMVPIPYRNSKLTHLLKDSLGGNSKTIMIATVRNYAAHYQQTVVSLMYASRAKKVKNRSSVNRNVMGDTGITAVNTEIEGLRRRLDERSLEFDRLRTLRIQDVQEKAELKSKLTQLEALNEAEKGELEAKMSTIIHSQAGEITNQRQKISILQKGLRGELTNVKAELTEKEEKIRWLTDALDQSQKQADSAVDAEEVAHMRKAVEEWKCQNEHMQEEMKRIKEENGQLRSQNNSYALEIGRMLESNSKILDTILARRRDEDKLESALALRTRESALAREGESKVKSELEMVSSRYRALSDVVVQQEEQLRKAVSALDTLEVGFKEMIAPKDEQISALKAQKKTLLDENSRLATECDELKRKTENTLHLLEKSALSAVEEGAKKVAVSTSALNESQAKLHDAQKQVATLTEQLADSKVQEEAALQKAVTANAALQTTTDALESAQAEVKREKDEEAEMAATFSKYIETYAARLNSVNEEHVRMQDELAAELKDLREKTAAHESEHGAGGAEALQKLREDYQKREERHKAHYKEQLQRVHDYLGEVEGSLAVKINDTIVSTNRTLTARKLEYFAHVLARMQRKYKDRLNEVTAEKDAAQKDLLGSSQKLAMVEAKLAEAEDAHRNAVDATNSAVKTAQEEYQANLAAFALKASNDLNTSLAAQKASLEAQHEEALRVLQAEQREAMLQAELARNQLECQKDEEGKEMQQLQQEVTDYKGQVKSLEDQLNRAVDAAAATSQNDHEKVLKLKEALSATEERVQDNEQALLSVEQKHMQTLSELQRSHAVAMDEKESTLARVQDELCRSQEQGAILVKEHAQELQTVRASLEADREKKAAESVSAFEEAIREHEAREASLQSELERLQAASKDELSALVGKYTTQLDALEVKSKEDLRATLEEQRRSLNDEHVSVVEALNRQHADSQAELEAALRKQIHGLEASLGSVKEEGSSALAELQARLTDTLQEQVESEKKVSAITEQHLVLQEALNRVSAAKDEDDARGRQERDSILERLRTSELALEEELAATKTLRNDFAARTSELEGQLSFEMAAARKKFEEELRSLEQRSAQDLQRSLSDQKGVLDNAREAEVLSMRTKYEDEAKKALEARDAEVASVKLECDERVSHLQCTHEEETSKALEEKLALQGQLTTLSGALAALQERHTEQGSRLELDVARVSEEIHQATSAKEKLVVELNDARELLKALQAEAAESEDELQSLRVKLDDSAANAIKMSEQLQATEAVISSREQELSDSAEQVSTLKHALQAASAQEGAIRLELERVTDAAAAAANRSAEELSTASRVASERENELTEKLATLEELSKERVAQLLTAVATLTAEKEKVATTLSDAECTVKETKESLDDAHARLEARDSQAQAAEQALQEMVSSLELSSRQKEEEVNALELRVASLERQDEASRLLVEELQKRVGASLSSEEERVASLSTELQSEHEKCARLASELQAMHANVTKEALRADSLQNVLTATNENHMSERLDMTERVNAANKRATSFEKHLENQREESRVAIQQVRMNVTALEEEKRKIGVELARVKQAHKEQAAHVDTLKTQRESEISDLKEHLVKQQEASLSALREQHRMQLEALKGDHDDRSSQQSNKEEALNLQVLQLEADMEGQAKTHDAVKADLTQSLNDSQAEVDALRLRLAALEQEYKDATDRHTARVKHAQSAHDLELVEVRSAHAADLESALQKQKQVLAGQHKSALEKLKADLASQHEQNINSAVARQEVRVTELLGTVKQLEGQKKTLVLEVGSLRASYASQKEAIEESHAAALNEKETALNLIKGELETALAAKNRAEEQLAAHIDAHAEELNAARVKAEEDAERLASQLGEDKQSLVMAHLVELGSAAEKHAITVASHEAKASELSSLLGSKDKKVVELEESLQTAEEAKAEALQSVLQERAQVAASQERESALQEEVQRLTASLASESDFALQRVKSEQEETKRVASQLEHATSHAKALEQELSLIRDTHQTALDEASAAHAEAQQSIDALALQYNDLQTAHTQLQGKAEAAEQELALTRVRLQVSNEAVGAADEARAELSRARAEHEQMVASLKEQRRGDEADLRRQMDELQQALEQSQHAAASDAAEAARAKSQYEASLRNMETEYTKQAVQLEQQQKEAVKDYERQNERVQWQYDVTMKCLASMTDRRKLLTEAFAKAGVNQEARELLLRDSGSDEDDYDVIYGSGVQSEHPSLPPPPGHAPGGHDSVAGVAASATAAPFQVSDRVVQGSHARHETEPHNTITTISHPSTSAAVSNTHGSGNVTDQFIAAVLDGDVQGMLSAVRSQGDDLAAPFWRSTVHSVQPLHRAVSGLQYHGNESLLVSMIKALVKIGADVNATDKAGNTPLHKAILVCTSKNVVNVVSVLLLKGADVNQVNHVGDAPLHLECRRIRKASVYVISALLEAGAESSLRASCGVEGIASSSSEKVTPLTMVMLGSLDHYASQGAKAGSTRNYDLWIFAAHALVTASPHDAWDAAYRSEKLHATQLHLLGALFPSQKESAAAYKSLFLHALKHGGFFGAGGGAAGAGVSADKTAVRMCALLTGDLAGVDALSTLLKKMATTPMVKDIHSGANVGYPTDLLDMILQYIFVDGPSAANSRAATEELVAALVSCVRRFVESSMVEDAASPSCLTHCVKFLEELGLLKGRQRRNQSRQIGKGLEPSVLDPNNTENSIQTRSTTNYL